MGSLAAQHRRLPNGGGQQQAQRRRKQNWWLAAPRETRTSRPPGGEGGRRHTLPAMEGHALAPPGLPIAQRQHTSAWQRWKKQRRKTASIRSGLVRGPALIEGKRLETRGIKVRPSLLTATHHNVEFSSAPRGCKGSHTELAPVQHSTGGTPARKSLGLVDFRQNGGPGRLCVARSPAERLTHRQQYPCAPTCSEMAQRGSCEQVLGL